MSLLVEPLRAPEHQRIGIAAALRRLQTYPVDCIGHAFARHKIAMAWWKCIKDAGMSRQIKPHLMGLLRQHQRDEAVRAMIHEAALQRLAAALRREGIGWVAIKGLHLGEEVYGDPLLRPAGDIDILVMPSDRKRAAGALVAAGFDKVVAWHPITHEITFMGHGASIDLHWHLLRPGRARRSLAPLLLQHRRLLRDDLWVPSTIATTLLLLIHPAITDYVTARLIRALDLQRWLRQHAGTAQEAARLAEEAGLRTAAWAMLQWTGEWFGQEHPHLLAQLAPGRWRARYLSWWIHAVDPVKVLEVRPRLAHIGFSLPLQDTLQDVVRASCRRLRMGSLGTPAKRRAQWHGPHATAF